MAEPASTAFQLVAKNLSARRGGRLAFAGASLTIGGGDVFLLRGPNGAGKSTLLRVLAGRSRPEQGSLKFSGGGEWATAATLLGHADGLKGALTAQENLRLWRSLYGADEGRVTDAANAMEVTAFIGQRAYALSAGQRRRVALCRPIISGRPIWLLDEPTAGMDGASVTRVIAAIEAHAAKGGAALIATHEPLSITNARTITMTEAA